MSLRGSTALSTRTYSQALKIRGFSDVIKRCRECAFEKSGHTVLGQGCGPQLNNF
jgi:hypothetical protein